MLINFIGFIAMITFGVTGLLTHGVMPGYFTMICTIGFVASGILALVKFSEEDEVE